jgi:D-aminoacyl-tRNA deacylase
MRAVVQRVAHAGVVIDGAPRGAISQGLLVFLGVEEADTLEDVDWLSGKISRLRVFPDEAGLMNRSVAEAGGGLLVISQFTLHASTRKGNRPSFTRAAKPDVAIPLYEAFLRRVATDSACPVAAGEFGADMKVSLLNDGPVTLCIDSKNRE